MKTKDFNYDLPEELIAQHPIKNREQSKLLVLDREKDTIEHRRFENITDYLQKGDCLVLNNTKVMAARIFGHRPGKDEKIEILLLKEITKDVWEVMVRPGRKARPGHNLVFGDGLLKGEIESVTETGTRHIKFEYNGIFHEILDELGEMPLPPYITERLEEGERYQTVFSKHIGSAAAPTAGLHFTKELMKEIEEIGVKIAYITLHVGLGTFSPVREDEILNHHMHSEFYVVDGENADIINNTKKSGGNIISVGTTSTRTLESIGNEDGFIEEGSGWTDIFIYPGYKFKVVDQLITNFHLPESTLIMLVSAFANREQVLKTYEVAIKEKYRFFSFGDAMYIK